MSERQAVEAQVKEAVRAILDAWIRPEAIDEFLSYVAEDFTGFGTGSGQYMDRREALRALTNREQAHLDVPVSYDLEWLHVHPKTDEFALADGFIRTYVHLGEGDQTVPVRFSYVMQRREARWLLVHAHFSMPDAMVEDGGTLMDLLERRNRELEEEVAKRTRELERSLEDLRAAQAQLVQQEKMASLGALTAGIAHEIKNPLNFVNNFAALSRELADELNEELGGATGPAMAILDDLRTNAQKIEEHGRRADSIVRSMLDHSRGGTGERRAVDLNALIEEYVDLAWHGQRARVPDFSAEVARDLDPGVGQVDVVPQDIGRVLLNLVGNAFDAVREAPSTSSPRVIVTTHRRDDEVEILVSDNGPGIPEADRDRVFEPFFSTKPTGSGTGLGLSLSYDIVTQGHGGSLTLHSEPGRGATFTIRLPAPRKDD